MMNEIRDEGASRELIGWQLLAQGVEINHYRCFKKESGDVYASRTRGYDLLPNNSVSKVGLSRKSTFVKQGSI